MTITPKEAHDWLIMRAIDGDMGRKPNPSDKQRLIANLVAKQAAEIARLQEANELIAPWLSAALEDSLSGVEFKKDVEKWFELVKLKVAK
jgi:hypothetical protein